jgi:hypothetical protein
MRLLVLPYMLEGSSMPRMINTETYKTIAVTNYTTKHLSVLHRRNTNHVSLNTEGKVTFIVPFRTPSTLGREFLSLSLAVESHLTKPSRTSILPTTCE